MKKLLLSLGAILALTTASFSQTTLFQDDFEAGSGNWTLNTGSGSNNWVVNNAYLGFSGLIPDTPNQPGAITNSPQSFYMHITNTTVCGGLSVCNANYDAGGTSDFYTQLATPIDASSSTNITLSFWYLCQGLTNVAFGTLEYSVDGGSTWTPTGTVYQNTGAWTQETVSLPAWDNVAALSFRFRWQNTNSGSGTDPSFSIDELLVQGTSGGSSNTITTDTNIQPASWCEGSVITTQVNFTSTGTFTAGNIYTAQLSDATGSFAAPTVIGTLTSTSNTGMIVGVIPGSIPAGTGYRIRVVSDSPSTIGSDNTVNLVVNAPPTVTMGAFSNVCQNDPAFALTGGSPASGTYNGPGVSSGMFNPGFAGIGTHTITYTYVDGNGCSGQAFETITVDLCGSNTITTGTNIQPTSWCEGQAMTTQVNFTSTGTFTTGNIYTAEISDASGSFAAPTVIGTQASTSNTGMIVGVIPGSMPAGTGYRIRVVSDNPAIIGSDNGVDLVINANPTVTQAPFSDVCLGGGTVTLVGASPAGGTYSGTGVSGTSFDPTIAGVGSTNISYSYTDGNGCSGNASEPITVINSPTVTLASFANVCSTDPFFTITGGSPSNGTYTGPGITGGVFDPSAAGIGTHTITYSFTDGNGCTGTANSTIIVEQCGGLFGEDLISFQIQPNPIVNSFEIVTEANLESIELLDLSGRIITSFEPTQLTYSIEAIPAGVYIVRVGAGGNYSEQRIIVQ